jgi:hypothetical protein
MSTDWSGQKSDLRPGDSHKGHLSVRIHMESAEALELHDSPASASSCSFHSEDSRELLSDKKKKTPQIP